MKLVTVLAIVLITLICGGGAFVYFQYPGIMQELAGQNPCNPGKPDQQVEKAKSDHLKANVEGIKSNKKGDRVEVSKTKPEKKGLDKFDFSDAKQRMKAQEQVLDDVRQEGKEIGDFIEKHGVEHRKKEERANAITNWLEKTENVPR